MSRSRRGRDWGEWQGRGRETKIVLVIVLVLEMYYWIALLISMRRVVGWTWSLHVQSVNYGICQVTKLFQYRQVKYLKITISFFLTLFGLAKSALFDFELNTDL